MNDIPKHWQLKKLGDVCKLKNGYAFKSDKYENKGVPVIRISDINGGTVSSQKAVRVKANAEYDNYLVENNDILVAMSGATTGKFGVYRSTEKAYQNQRVGKFKILNENILNNEFLFHQINSLKRQIEKDAYGGAQPNISSTKIEQMQIAVPPIAEQQAIVVKIEELLSELENGKQQLQTAQQQLKVYRQSLLKWAFEGKLTNKKVKDGELPKGWKRTTLGNVISISSGNGLTRTKRDDEGKYLVYGGNGVTGKHSEYLFEDEKLIIGRVGVHCGNAHITKPKSWVTDNAFIVTFDEKEVSRNFLLHLIKVLNLNKYSVSTAQPVISQGKLYPIEVSIPPLEEQQLIEDELDSKFTVCDKIEETISQSLQQAETLRQSILKKAFEGNLL